jgi:hypothetical protein
VVEIVYCDEKRRTLQTALMLELCCFCKSWEMDPPKGKRRKDDDLHKQLKNKMATKTTRREITW